jgi:hypothetical protein
MRSRSCAIAELIRLKKIQIGPAFPIARRDFLLRPCLSRRLRRHSIYPACDQTCRRTVGLVRSYIALGLVRGDDEPTRSDHC